MPSSLTLLTLCVLAICLGTADAKYIERRAVIASESTSSVWALPTTLTPHYEPVAAVDNLGTAVHTDFTVASYARRGRMQDTTNYYNVYRDGGGYCSLNNQTFWFWCDTSAYSRTTNKVVKFASNSIALANSLSAPESLTDISATGTTVTEVVPFTPQELARNKADWAHRFALYTYANCVRLSDTSAAHYWQVMDFGSTTGYNLQGGSLAVYNHDAASSTLTVSRDQELFFNFTQGWYLYGSFSNLVVNGYAYLYALDYYQSSRQDVHLARVKVGGVRYRSNYQYYNASSGTWSTTAPSAKVRNKSAAVIQGTIGFYSGAMFYSEYHNAYLLVFMSSWADNKFRVLYAASPTGPWLGNNKIIYSSIEGPKGVNYAGIASPIFFGGAYPQGQNLALMYTYRDSNATYPYAVRLKFA